MQAVGARLLVQLQLSKGPFPSRPSRLLPLAGLEGPPAHLRPVGRGDGASRRGARCGQRHGESRRLSTATSSAVRQQRGAAGWIGSPA